MARIYLVRHGQAKPRQENAGDPGLDSVGKEQAQILSRTLVGIGPIKILTSPMNRTKETAAPLATLWKIDPVIEKAVSEIPTPQEIDPPERILWLRAFMNGSWNQAPQELLNWREGFVRFLKRQNEDVVVFTHFIVLNTALGYLSGDERVVIFRPGCCSVTIIENNDGELQVLSRGDEKNTVVL